MTPEEHARLQRVQQRRWPLPFIRDDYGLDLASDAPLRLDYLFWMSRRGVENALRCSVKLFAENQGELTLFLNGSELPEVPPEVRQLLSGVAR